jgi:hypothetical protein
MKISRRREKVLSRMGSGLIIESTNITVFELGVIRRSLK